MKKKLRGDFLIYFLYNLVIFLLFILMTPLFLFQVLFNKKKRGSIPQRLGFINNKIFEIKDKKIIWIHAGSTGEIKIAKNLIDELNVSINNAQFVVSYGGTSGKKIASKLLEEYYSFYLPIDLLFIIKKFIRKLNPDVFILIENGLWPNLIYELNKIDCKMCLTNFKIDENSVGAYNNSNFFLKRVLNKFDLISLQNESDKKNLIKIGVDKDLLNINGNLKYDIVASNVANNKTLNKIKNNLFLLDKQNIIVAGSTHDGEEKILLDTYRKLKQKYKDLILIIAPRNLERVQKINELVSTYNYKSSLKSDVDSLNDIIIIDTMGDLAEIYGISKLAFIGGTLANKGGHNLYEPLVYGVPVLYGPFIANIRQTAEMLTEKKIAFKVKDSNELYTIIDRFLDNANELKKVNRRINNIISKNKEAISENINSIIKVINN